MESKGVLVEAHVIPMFHSLWATHVVSLSHQIPPILFAWLGFCEFLLIIQLARSHNPKAESSSEEAGFDHYGLLTRTELLRQR